MPPTDRRIEIDVTEICRFEDGKMVEHGRAPDHVPLLELGATRHPPRTVAGERLAASATPADRTPRWVVNPRSEQADR